MAKPKHPLMLRDSLLFAALSARARTSGRPVQDLLADALRAYLGPDAPPAPRPRPKAARPAPPMTPDPAPAATPLPRPASSLCRHCGHPKRAHWTRGCLAGCLCHESKFHT